MPETSRRCALITGASSGIGMELSKIFAVNGWNLVLVARNRDKLNELAVELQKKNGVSVTVVAQDLAMLGAARKIFEATREQKIAALVNNAGFGSYGRFADLELSLQLEIMQVNMTALVELTHLYAREMISRGSGRILNVSSTAAFQPGPTVNIYYASKAFVYSFSYALALELESTGVTVTTLCPGMTRTNFFERAKVPIHESFAMEAAAVAQAGYEGMLKGKRVVVPGLLNKIMSFLAKRTPPLLTATIVRRLHAPKVPG